MNESTTIAQFALSSEDLKDGERIPAVHGCEGEDLSPQLSWPPAPPGTKSFALIMDDPDAPNGTFRHWAVYDIPADVTELPSGDAGNFRQAVNDFGRAGYGGPCPPEGHGEHRYRFKLYALDVDALTVQPDAKVSQVEEEAKRHQIAMAQLTGTYERE
jgi:Raf kinase inhibitor-like YbhB/YbcL family protein